MKKKSEKGQTRRRLTKQRILEGIEYRMDVDLPAYPGCYVTIRPLKDSEVIGFIFGETGEAFAELSDAASAGGQLNKAARKIAAEKLLERAGMIDLMRSICKLGIVADTEEEDISELLDSMIGLSLFDIGIKIFEISHIVEEELEDFSGPPKATSSSDSISGDGGSEEATPGT